MKVQAIITVDKEWRFPNANPKIENTVWSRVRFDADREFKSGRWTMLMALPPAPRPSTCVAEIWMVAPSAPHHLLSPGATFDLIGSYGATVKGNGVVCESPVDHQAT